MATATKASCPREAAVYPGKRYGVVARVALCCVVSMYLLTGCSGDEVERLPHPVLVSGQLVTQSGFAIGPGRLYFAADNVTASVDRRGKFSAVLAVREQEVYFAKSSTLDSAVLGSADPELLGMMRIAGSDLDYEYWKEQLTARVEHLQSLVSSGFLELQAALAEVKSCVRAPATDLVVQLMNRLDDLLKDERAKDHIREHLEQLQDADPLKRLPAMFAAFQEARRWFNKVALAWGDLVDALASDEDRVGCEGLASPVIAPSPQWLTDMQRGFDKVREAVDKIQTAVQGAVEEWVDEERRRCALRLRKAASDSTVKKAFLGCGMQVAGQADAGVSVQGATPTAAVVGNGGMLVSFTQEGVINTLWYPRPGAYDHIPFDWSEYDRAKKEGSISFQGIFGGVHERGAGDEEIWWLADTSKWCIELFFDDSEGWPLLHMNWRKRRSSKDCDKVNEEPVSVHLEAFVDYNENRLRMRYTFSGDFDRFVLFAKVNVNEFQQEFGAWSPAANRFTCENDVLTWTNIDEKQYPNGDDVEALHIAISAQPKPATTRCGPSSGIGESCYSEVTQVTYEVVANGELREVQLQVYGAPDVSWRRPFEDAKDGTKKAWIEWLGVEREPDNQDYKAQPGLIRGKECAADSLCRLWLWTLKMLADRIGGGIIASPTRQPQYWMVWPRDGTFQAIALLLTGHVEEAERFFNFLFSDDVLRGDEKERYWVTTTDLFGNKAGLAAAIKDAEEYDQAGIVLWGVWLFKQITGRLPSAVDQETWKLEAVGRHLETKVETRSEGVRLLAKSLDWAEHPCSDIATTLHSNAAAAAGFAALSELLADQDAADNFRKRAEQLRDGVARELCPNGSCLVGLGGVLGYDDKITVQKRPERAIMTPFWPFAIFPMNSEQAVLHHEEIMDTLWVEDSRTGSLRLKGDEGGTFVTRAMFTYLYLLQSRYRQQFACFPGKPLEPRDEAAIEYFRKELRRQGGDLLTEIGYVRDKYSENPAEQASVPLGWAQAMAILGRIMDSWLQPVLLSPVPRVFDSEQRCVCKDQDNDGLGPNCVLGRDCRDDLADISISWGCAECIRRAESAE